MINTLLHDLIAWLITMQKTYGGCTWCMRAVHAVAAPVVARCIHCAFYDISDGFCMFNRLQPQGCDTLAAGCDMFEREDLTDCVCYELD